MLEPHVELHLELNEARIFCIMNVYVKMTNIKKENRRKIAKIVSLWQTNLFLFYLTNNCIGNSHKRRPGIQFSNMLSPDKNLVHLLPIYSHILAFF